MGDADAVFCHAFGQLGQNAWLEPGGEVGHIGGIDLLRFTAFRDGAEDLRLTVGGIAGADEQLDGDAEDARHLAQDGDVREAVAGFT